MVYFSKNDVAICGENIKNFDGSRFVLIVVEFEVLQ